MTELGEQERFSGGPTITLDLPTVRFLRMRATQQSDNDTTFVIRGPEGVGTSIETIKSIDDVEKIVSSGTREFEIVACGVVRAPKNVDALSERYTRIGCTPEIAAIYGANCPQPKDLDSELLKKLDELNGTLVPRLIVGKYGDSAIINPFSQDKYLPDPPTNALATVRLDFTVNPMLLIDDGIIVPGTTLVYDVKAKVDGKVVFSGNIGDPNFFVLALRQDR